MTATSPLLNRQRQSQESGNFRLTEILQHLLDGGAAGDVIGFDENENEALYTLGHFQYSQGKYADALKLFQLVVFHDHLNRRALKALGSCLHMLKHYEEAIKSLGLAMLIDPGDPGPSFQIAECMLALGQKENAGVVLTKLIEEFGALKEHSAMTQKATGMLELIKLRKI